MTAPARQPTSAHGGKAARLMIVEDDELVLGMLRAAVRINRLGRIIAEADTSEDANRLAAENRPDVIVLDLGLRDARGDVVFDGIRLASPASRVVVYTAHESQQSWYESRGATFVSKSTGSDEIVSALRSA